MDDRYGSDTLFDADVNEFELLLDDADELDYVPHEPIEARTDETGQMRTVTATPSRQSRLRRGFRRQSGPYRPRRLHVSPDWSRLAAAAFVGIVLLFIVWFAISSFVAHRRQVAFEDYVTGVTQLMTQSDSQGEELSTLLQSSGRIDRANIVSRLDKLSVQADKLVARGRSIDMPDSARASRRYLLQTLEYRHNGLVAMRKAMTSALSTTSDKTAAVAVVAAMQRLVASDVVWADSFQTVLRDTLADEKVTGVTVPDSIMVKDPELASTRNMALALERLRAGVTAPIGANGKVKSLNDGKTHGGQLTSVTMIPSGQSLSSGGTTEVTGSDQLAFEVTFQNQGDVQETNVPVRITLSGDHTDMITLSGRIESVNPGEVASVRIPLDEAPSFGEVLKTVVQVGPVPGEKKTDNNNGTYELMFRL